MYSPKSVAVSASSRVPSNECICRRCVCAELLAVARAHAQPPRAQDYLWYNALSSKALPHSTDGSVVEFSPATREARVRFPVSATFFFFFFLPNPSSFFFSLLLAQRFSPLPRMILLESVQFFLFTFLLLWFPLLVCKLQSMTSFLYQTEVCAKRWDFWFYMRDNYIWYNIPRYPCELSRILLLYQ